MDVDEKAEPVTEAVEPVTNEREPVTGNAKPVKTEEPAEDVPDDEEPKEDDGEEDAEGEEDEDEVKLAAKQSKELPEGFIEWEAVSPTIRFESLSLTARSA